MCLHRDANVAVAWLEDGVGVEVESVEKTEGHLTRPSVFAYDSLNELTAGSAEVRV